MVERKNCEYREMFREKKIANFIKIYWIELDWIKRLEPHSWVLQMSEEHGKREEKTLNHFI